MKLCQIVIKSKNQKSIKNALFVFLVSLKHLKFKILKKNFEAKKKKTVLTILKSPHVNKTAQEQFEIRYFSNRLTIYSIKKFKALVLLKKLKTNLFSDIDIKTKCVIDEKSENKIKIKMFDFDNIKTNDLIFKTSQFVKRRLSKKIGIKTIKEYRKIESKQIKKFLRVLDIYGEFNSIYCLNSSEGRALD